MAAGVAADRLEDVVGLEIEGARQVVAALFRMLLRVDAPRSGCRHPRSSPFRSAAWRTL